MALARLAGVQHPHRRFICHQIGLAQNFVAQRFRQRVQQFATDLDPALALLAEDQAAQLRQLGLQIGLFGQQLVIGGLGRGRFHDSNINIKQQKFNNFF
ncbi:MAG: hypothetical protein ONB41_25515 [candidate division KSB1 bacterium]|nr:hypothetical protein [candidate division KSB1 bacterium]